MGVLGNRRGEEVKNTVGFNCWFHPRWRFCVLAKKCEGWSKFKGILSTFNQQKNTFTPFLLPRISLFQTISQYFNRNLFSQSKNRNDNIYRQVYFFSLLCPVWDRIFINFSTIFHLRLCHFLAEWNRSKNKNKNNPNKVIKIQLCWWFSKQRLSQRDWMSQKHIKLLLSHFALHLSPKRTFISITRFDDFIIPLKESGNYKRGMIF